MSEPVVPVGPIASTSSGGGGDVDQLDTLVEGEEHPPANGNLESPPTSAEDTAFRKKLEVGPAAPHTHRVSYFISTGGPSARSQDPGSQKADIQPSLHE